MLDVNLSGVSIGMKYEIPALREAGGGAIVNVASILGRVGFAGASAYVAAKHGVVGLTKTAAIELAAEGIRVNVVGPGFIETPMISELEKDAKSVAMLVGLHPIGRLELNEHKPYFDKYGQDMPEIGPWSWSRSD